MKKSKVEINYKKLFESSSVATILFDQDRLYECNEAALSLFKIDSKEEFLQLSPWELSPETQPDGTNSKKSAKEHIERAFNKETDFFEWTYQTANRKNFSAEVKLSRFELEDRKVLQALIGNKTDSKEIMKELNLTQFSVDNAAIGIVQITPEGKLEYVNDKICELLGYSQEELIGMKVSDIDPHFPAEERERRWIEIKQNKVNKIETHLQTKEGEIIPVQVTSKYLKNKDKEYEFAFVRDISEEKKRERELREANKELDTQNEQLEAYNQQLQAKEQKLRVEIEERKQAEKELHEKKRRYDELAEQSRAFVWEIDKKGLYTYVDPLVKKIIGYKPEELENKKYFYDICPEDQREEIKQVGLENLRQEITVYNHENKIERKDGEVIWVSTNGVPLKNDDGEIVGFRGMDIDINRLKQLEQKLTDKNRELDARIQQLDAANQELKTTEKQLRAEIQERRDKEHELQKNYQFQKLTSEISSTFFKATSENFDANMNEVLAKINNFFQVGRCYLFLFSEDNKTMTNTHEWCTEGVDSRMDNIVNEPVKNVSWLSEKIRSQDYVHIPDVDELPEEASAEKKEFKAQNIKSLLSVPTSVTDKILGFIGLDAVKDHYCWNDHEIHNLQVIANIVGYQLLRNQKELELERALSEKKTLLKEVHHRVKNNLQVICSLLRLQKFEIEDEASFRVLEAFESSRRRVFSMAKVHNQIYQTDHLAGVEPEIYLRDLTNAIIETWDFLLTPTVKFDVDPDVILEIDEAIHIGLILNELISNSLEHAVDERGQQLKITIEMSRGNDKYCLRIADNGCGLDPDFDIAETSSLGLQLVRSLAEEQLEGELNISVEEGTEFEIRFPA